MFAAAATIAIGCSFSTAAAEPVEARVYALGSDYFTDGIFDFKCKVVPTDDSSASFYAACTREQANDLGGGEVVTLDIGPRPAAEMTPKAAATAARLQMVPPRHEIIRRIRANTTTAGPTRRRRQTMPEGPRSILIVLVNYVDMEVTYATEASARLMIQNPEGRSVDGLYQAVSYGRLSWPEALTTVITVNSSRRGADLEGCASYDMAYEANRLANQRPDVNTADFNHTAYLIPDQIEACKWSGQAETTGGKVWVRSGSGSILAHELGHNLGLAHAASDPDDDGVLEDVYGDGGSIMGTAGRWVSVNAPHREQLGYIGEDNGIETYDMDCTAHSPRLMTISRLDLAPGPGNPNPNMVRIARHPRADYLLSFKALADWDGVPADVNLRNRLQIHTHDGSNHETLLVKALADSESFTGAASRDGASVPLSITVTDTSADTITVTIDTCSTQAPTGEGETYAPTSAPFDQSSFRGNVVCGETVTGTTELPGVNIIGNAAADHYWHFSLLQSMAVTFDGCASEYDTWIRVMNRNLTIEIAQLDDGGGCSSESRTRLAVTLPAGEYAVVMEGYADHAGTYTMRVVCPPPPPPPPTVCMDADEHCGIWRGYGYCLSATHDQYMYTNCRASCGLCPGNALRTPPSNNVPDPVVTTTALVTSTATPNTTVCHHALCGMYVNEPARPRCTIEHDHCAEHFERHEVRCCSDTLKPGWRKHTDQCPWAESDNWNADVTSCQYSKTFDEADAFCTSVGARLCTRAEIQTNCVRATGCGHDLHLVWSSHADVIDHAGVAANIGYATTSDEPETDTDTMAIGADQQIELAADNSATTTDDDNNSNGASIALAVLGSLGMVTALATVLYLRQQRQKSKQLEDDNARPLDLLTAGSSANQPALSLRAASEDEVFQLSPDGHSIRLESVQRGNPLYSKSRRPSSTVID